MAISKEKKGEILTKLSSALDSATAIAFVGFSKLTVADASALRKTLAGEGVSYFVAKKTLIKKALMERGYEGVLPELPGEVAIAWTTGEDETAPSRGVYAYGKKLKGALSLLGGVFMGAFADQEKMTTVASIPPVPVLRGMFVNVLNSPIQGLVIVLDKIRAQKA